MTKPFFRTNNNMYFCGVWSFFTFISFDNFSYCRASKHGTANEENFYNIDIRNSTACDKLVCCEGMCGGWSG
jgi:hypothetical protein